MSQIQSLHAMLSSIKNGANQRLLKVTIKHSKLCYKILTILYEEGYITDFKQHKDKQNQKNSFISISLKYYDNKSVITHLEALSNRNVTLQLLNSIDLGAVTYIISTPLGIVSGKEARRLGVGGILLCSIW